MSYTYTSTSTTSKKFYYALYTALAIPTLATIYVFWQNLWPVRWLIEWQTSKNDGSYYLFFTIAITWSILASILTLLPIVILLIFKKIYLKITSGLYPTEIKKNFERNDSTF